MPASCIFATAPRQAGASRGSGHRSRVGADQGNFVGRRKTRRQSKQGRPKRLPAKATGKINCARAATQNGGTKSGSQSRDGQRDGAVAAKAEAKKSVSTACETDFSIAIHCRTKARHSSTPDPASSPLPRYGCSPQSERSPRSESAMSGPRIRELATLEEGS